MRILVTSAGTSYGDGWATVLAENHGVTCFGPSDHPSIETVRGDRREYETVRTAVEGVDAIVDLPADIDEGAGWEPHHRMLQGTHNLLRAAEEAEIQQYVVGSTNKTVEGYEIRNAPEVYETDSEFTVDHTVPPRPTKPYAVSRLYAEFLAKMYAQSTDWQVGRHVTRQRAFPTQVYVVRWGSVRLTPGMDHPYSDAEYGVENGLWERDSRQYELAVKRMKATWLSGDDLGHLLECILHDDGVTFDIFYGVSDNDRRWLDIEHAAERLGYDPQDNGEEWAGPPE
jgi:hypothetical protein